MTDRELNYRDLFEIAQWVESSAQISEFRLTYKGVEIEIVKAPSGAPPMGSAARSRPNPATEQAAPAAAPAETVLAPGAPASALIADGMCVLRAPMVGTFYRAPAPGAQPFVQTGDAVRVGDTLCILEVMKLMNSLDADTAGVVREILVTDGQIVEYGQPLIVIEPTP